MVSDARRQGSPPGHSPLPDDAGASALFSAPDGGGVAGAQAGEGPRRLVQWMTLVTRLASLQRFSMERLSSRESVMEHLGQVTLTALALAVEVSSREQGCGVSVASVLPRAIVHDIEEVITGDVARPTKHASDESRRLFDDLSDRSVAELKRELYPYLPHFASAMQLTHGQAKMGRDGCVVALADVLAVVTKVWEETILRGSGAMIRQAHTAQRQLVVMQAKIDREFGQGGPAHSFLSEVVADALLVMSEAARRDSQWLGTKVERY